MALALSMPSFHHVIIMLILELIVKIFFYGDNIFPLYSIAVKIKFDNAFKASNTVPYSKVITQ